MRFGSIGGARVSSIKAATCRFTGDRVTETPASYTGDGVSCRAPSSPAPLCKHLVDGIHYGPGVRLTVAGPPVVAEMGPESGPESGAILTFAGANLVAAATEQAKCRFGDQ